MYYSLFNLYLQNYYGLQFWINTYICSEPVCLYLFWSRVLYFLAQFRSDHFSKQIGLNPGCSVMQQGGTGTSCITKSPFKVFTQDSISWQHQASCGFCKCVTTQWPHLHLWNKIRVRTFVMTCAMSMCTVKYNFQFHRIFWR
jgi:hypothetical protein